RIRPDAEPQPTELLLDRLFTPEQRRRQVGHLRGRLIDGPVDRAHLGEAPQHLDELVAVEALARSSDQLDEHLARVPALTDDEMAEVPRVLGLVVGLEPLPACPVTDGAAD